MDGNLICETTLSLCVFCPIVIQQSIGARAPMEIQVLPTANGSAELQKHAHGRCSRNAFDWVPKLTFPDSSTGICLYGAAHAEVYTSPTCHDSLPSHIVDCLLLGP
jgi:hypothetical protein